MNFKLVRTAITIFCCFFTLSQIVYSQTFEWVRNIGGPANEFGQAITLDDDENVYVTGYFEGTADFDPSNSSSYNMSSNGELDVFVVKLDSGGNFIWARQLGGLNSDIPYSINFFENGIYISGQYMNSVDFNPGLGVNTFTSNGNYDCFLVKLDLTGNYLWSKSWGNVGYDYCYATTISPTGLIANTGTFSGTIDLNPNGAIYLETSVGGLDIYVNMIDTAGNFQSAVAFGGAGNDVGRSVAFDNQSRLLVAGKFEGSVDFDPSGGAAIYNSFGGSDIFYTRFDASLNYHFTKIIHGTGTNDDCRTIKTDSQNSVFLTGHFDGVSDFDPNAGIQNDTTQGGFDIYLLKLDSIGEYSWNNCFGSVNADVSYKLDVDFTDNIYINGYFNNVVDFDPGIGIQVHNSYGFDDVFIVKLSNNGNYLWSIQLGGANSDIGFGLSVSNSNIYSTGGFSVTCDFDPSVNSYNLTSTGGSNVFVHKLSQCFISDPYFLYGDTLLCAGDSSLLISASPTGNLWNNGSTNDSLVVTQTGNYALQITQSPSCIVQSDSILITVFELTSVSFQLPKNEYCINETNVQLNTGNPIGGSYSGNGVSGNVFNPNSAGLGQQIITYSLIDTNGCTASTSDTVNVIECMGIEGINSNRVVLYPNPTSDFLTIEISEDFVNSTIMISNPIGQIVLMIPVIENKIKVNITALAKGVYFVSIGKLTYRIIKA